MKKFSLFSACCWDIRQQHYVKLPSCIKHALDCTVGQATVCFTSLLGIEHNLTQRLTKSFLNTCWDGNLTYEPSMWIFRSPQLMGFQKASMEFQDKAQITFRSEIHSIVFQWVSAKKLFQVKIVICSRFYILSRFLNFPF